MIDSSAAAAPTQRRHWRRQIRKSWQLYVLILLPALYIIIFHYIPMAGITVAFKDFRIHRGILGSPWVGLKYFEQFFHSPLSLQLIKNTLTLSVYELAAAFPMPIILALALNQTRNIAFKKTVQLVTYAPYFISLVVMVGIVVQFSHPRFGVINSVIALLGGEPINFIGMPALFSSIYVGSVVWQYTGFDAIIYIAALASIDQELQEAAIIDGASAFQRTLYIEIPGITPTIVVLFILHAGQLMNLGFERVFLLQNPLNLSVSEILATYVYKVGLVHAQYSFSTAVGFFNSLVNFVLIVSLNAIARRVGETSLW